MGFGDFAVTEEIAMASLRDNWGGRMSKAFAHEVSE